MLGWGEKVSGLSRDVLTPAQMARVNTIENVVANNAFAHDFEGVRKELSGISTGWDHVTEMQQSVVSLEKAISGLAGSLQNPKLASDARAILEYTSFKGELVLKEMKSALGVK